MKRGSKKGSIHHLVTNNQMWCFVCQQYKPIEDFYRNISNSDSSGYNHACKACKGKYDKQYQHGYYLLHRDELLPKHRTTAINSINRRKQLTSRLEAN